jgi:hypothetical protein
VKRNIATTRSERRSNGIHETFGSGQQSKDGRFVEDDVFWQNGLLSGN